jgi:Zn-dependent protease with chaperone function
MSTIIAALVLTTARSLLGNPIYATDLFIVALIIWIINFATQLFFSRRK